MTWVVIALAVLLVIDGLKLRGRASALAALPDGARESESGAAGQIIAATGVFVPDGVAASVAVHAATESLDVIDLIPRDLPTLRALALTQWVDTAKYRGDRLGQGSTVGHAMFATDDVRGRARVTADDTRDVPAFYRLAARIKRYACASADFAVAPVRATPQSFATRKAVLQGAAGAFAPVIQLVQLGMLALLVAGLAIPGMWPYGLAAVGAFHLQPIIAFTGTALAPKDLWWVSLLRLPVEIVTWVAIAVVPKLDQADPVAERRPMYDQLLAADPATLFEPTRATCPLCASNQLVAGLHTSDLLQHKPGRFRISRCKACDHLFQNPRLSVAGLDFYYRDFYDGLGETNADIAFGMTKASYADRARMAAPDAPPTNWLDVGTGHGHFPRAAKELLPQTRFDGVDLSESVEEAERRGWIESGHRGLFPELAPSIAGQYEVVSMHHYLEHTLDPRAEIEAAHTALAPGGHLLIEVPNPDSGLRRVFGRYWMPWFQPQHLNFVSRGNIAGLLADAGLTPVQWHCAEAHQPVDMAGAMYLFLGRIAPPTNVPWRPPAGLARQVWTRAVWTVGLPLLLASFALDHVAAPLVRRAGLSNTYRVLAQKAPAQTEAPAA